MKQTISTYQIVSALLEDEYAGWSRRGAQALAEYLEGVEESTGEEMEFDRVAIRCDFSEYGSAQEAALEYGFKPEHGDDDDEIEASALEYLNERTTVIEFVGGVIVQSF